VLYTIAQYALRDGRVDLIGVLLMPQLVCSFLPNHMHSISGSYPSRTTTGTIMQVLAENTTCFVTSPSHCPMIFSFDVHHAPNLARGSSLTVAAPSHDKSMLLDQLKQEIPENCRLEHGIVQVVGTALCPIV